MKSLKKNSMSLALGIALTLGTALSFVPNQAQAFFEKIPCWSQGDGTSGVFVICSTCSNYPGQGNDGEGECRNDPTIQ